MRADTSGLLSGQNQTGLGSRFLASSKEQSIVRGIVGSCGLESWWETARSGPLAVSEKKDKHIVQDTEH